MVEEEIEMHPFIVERVPSLILAANKFMAKSLRQNYQGKYVYTC